VADERRSSLIRQYREAFAEHYLRHYASARPIDPARLEVWLTALCSAGASLMPTPGDRSAIERLVQKALST
jgi:hypothetical protein